MSNRARRFAGARLAALPVENVSDDLLKALRKLGRYNRDAIEAEIPDYIHRVVEVPGVRGAKLDIWATPERFRPEENFLSGNSGVPMKGNAADLQRIIDAKPTSIYDLSWEVDGEYAANQDYTRRDRMKIAQAAAKQWDEIIPQLQEGQLVGNHPYGVTEGDYRRADLYMQYGLGPVQPDMNQYGIVHNGHIEPISPMGPNIAYAKHLAERAQRGGDQELAQGLMSNLERLQGGGFERLDSTKQNAVADAIRQDEPNVGRETQPVRRRFSPQTPQFRDADDAIHQIQDNLSMFNDRIEGRNPTYRNIIGATSAEDFINQRRVRPDRQMRGRDALGILMQENQQPGSMGAQQLAQALVNLRQIQGNGFRVVRGAV